VSFEIKHHHGGVSVPNLAESIDWYTKVLGFEVERQFPIPQIPATVAMLKRGDLRVELFELPDAKPLPPERREPHTDLQTCGNKHLAFAIKHVDTVAEELKRLGADIVFVGHFQHGSNIFLRDNAGNLIELVEQPDLW
jgi:methylmalonyl-CoA/ethylmalonyl-CoA epimerase